MFTRWRIRKRLLDDLYIRFFRLAEERIGHVAEHGVVSFILNSSYLAGRSHPIMRESLCRSFQEIWIDNLNGDKHKTGKVIPQGLPGEGTTDQSIFTTEQDPRGIQVGTAITTLLKRRNAAARIATAHDRDFRGRAADKAERNRERVRVTREEGCDRGEVERASVLREVVVIEEPGLAAELQRVSPAQVTQSVGKDDGGIAAPLRELDWPSKIQSPCDVDLRQPNGAIDAVVDAKRLRPPRPPNLLPRPPPPPL